MSQLAEALSVVLTASEGVLRHLAATSDEGADFGVLDRVSGRCEEALNRLRDLVSAGSSGDAQSDPEAETLLARTRSCSDTVLTALRERQADISAERRALLAAGVALRRRAAAEQPRFVERRV